MKARALLLAPMLAALALPAAGCGEQASVSGNAGGSTTPPYVREPAAPSTLGEATTPVRIGELGPNFAACNARGAVRERASAEPVPVHAAPFDQAGEIDRLAPGAEFHICSRSHDQRWFGIVYDEGGRVTERCGVSGPVTARRDYDGPCAAGWVPSARVRFVSGVADQLPAAAAPQGE